MAPLRVSLEKSEFAHGDDLHFSLNEISIDDDVLTYGPRKETFINYALTTPIYHAQSLVTYEGEDFEHDSLFWFGFQLS